jgi:NAD(P)H-flavin reductase
MPTAVLSARHDAGGDLLLVSLDVDDAIARAYTTPGQYIEVKTPEANGYFVIASAVGETPWELLVKNAGGAADALATLPLGSHLSIEGPLGAGFSVARMTSRHVAVAVVGSALGVARPVLGQRIAAGAAAATHLLIGVRAPTDLAIAREVEQWAERGIHVVLCLSRAEVDHHREVLPRAHRVSGYVQHALARALETGEIPHGTLVIAAGPDAMLADMRTLATVGSSAGVIPAAPHMPHIEVLTNV